MTGLLERLNDFRREYLWCYVFVAPLLLLVGVFLLYPLVHAFIISFHKVGIGRDQAAQWVGASNFTYTLTNPVWQRAITNTAIYALVSVAANIVIALALAWLIFPLNPASQNFFKAAYYLPAHIGGIMVALVWYWMFDPMAGLLNYLVGQLGVPTQLWIKDPRTTLGVSNALWSMALIPILGGHGGGVILYLAAMGNIPKTLYEAADIDAASAASKFFRITLPLLKPTTLFVLVTSTIGSFQVFEYVYLLTQGGPNFGTITVVYQIYIEAFERYQFGMASAQAFVLGAIIVALSLVQFRIGSTDVEY
ncbi:MAG TPA: sugar ABC transporter permease [Chloroflexota bacterium]|jgi:multiple sugar transport system permease protein|nr:sugar ABC transporter permease [Chloroflexota bacterium]